MTSGRISQHRNYGDIMARHERDVRIKRVVRIFIYFLIIVFMIIVFLFVKKWEQRKTVPVPPNPATAFHSPSTPLS